ncbi:hypothetical protein BFP76_06990 [Amylibacter kogurei]|uniref:LPS export ABC transporter permease LptG n=1 Tax=Paramylibacter kogurei TaxID=1889778 RepID=A0A2G5K702_9RHOB|nr:LptF/LptG family permease [Amylibacter kogurei]PIB24899.1 hypothetical protein BFP76_06990 [Amylibacter kogurei]
MMLGLYFARRYLVAFVRVFLIVAALMFLADLLENVSRLGSVENATKRAFQLAGLNVSSLISQALPIIIMLASISFSVSMARSNEFVVSRAVGMSALKSLLLTAILAVSLGICSILFFEPFANEMLEKRNTLRNANKTQTVAVNDTGFWLRQKSQKGNMIVQAAAANDNGKILRDVTLLDFDQTGLAVDRYFATVAFLNNEELVLTDVKHWDVQSGNPENTAQTPAIKRFPTTITPAQILDGFPAPETIAIWALPKFAKQIEDAGFSSLKYRMQFQMSLARPLLFLAMFVIGTVFTLKNARMGNLGLAMLYALSFGFSLYFLQNFAKTLGEAGQVAVIMAAWFPALAACLMALAMFLHLEDG